MAFTASAVARSSKAKLSWLDLRGTGLSAIERLCLEEILLRHDDDDNRCWALVGTHEPTANRILKNVYQEEQSQQDANKSCVIVMGIGGKPDDLLNMDLVKEDGVLVVKRFSGGGTIVLDHSSLWTTFIGRNHLLPHVEPFPRSIMKWSADAVFGSAFASLSKQALRNNKTSGTVRGRPTLVIDTKSCSATENLGKVLRLPGKEQGMLQDIPEFALVETDYVMGDRKMGGNAQAIVKGGWLHHTSFLWDYQDDHMEYLSLPSKRPDYRGSRSHDDFLVKLRTYYGSLKPEAFFAAVKESCTDEFDVQDVTFIEAMRTVNDEVGGIQTWFDEKSRNKVVTLF